MAAMTLRTLMLRTLAEGKAVTAGGMSRRWGEDRHRCREWLDKFAKIGVVRRRTIKQAGNRRRSREQRDGVTVYVPVEAAVAAELARNP